MERSGSTSKSKPKAAETKSKVRSVKTGTTVSATRTARPRIKKVTPSEDEIRVKAQELYRERMTAGQGGSAEDDWLKAERILKG